MRSVTHKSAEGFSLVETVVASGILATGLLALAGVFGMGMRHMAGSSPGVIAREKAREAVESVHTARDTGGLAWAKIRNVADGGVFQAGAQSLRTPGADGLVNTADDGSVEQIRSAGADTILGNTDDVLTTLNDYTREVQINNLMTEDAIPIVNPNLRQIKVIVKYKADARWQTYTLTTFVSSFK